MIKKPMLAATMESWEDIKFPCLASAKLDGIRCLIINGKAVSRTLKPIRNHQIANADLGMLNGFDGELMIRDRLTAPFNEVSSAVMAESSNVPLEYRVFDWFDEHVPYYSRLGVVMSALMSIDIIGGLKISIVPGGPISNLQQLMEFEEQCVAKGFEGIMVRNPEGLYKQGRSTLREGGLIKIKRFFDDEAEILAIEEKMHNDNVATIDALGHTKRSQHQENKRPAGTMGSLLVKNTAGQIFSIGTGFDDGLRSYFWAERKVLIGRTVKYKYQEVMKNVPRFPVFLGFRDE